MTSALSRFATIVLVAILAVLGSIAGRAVWETATAEDEPKAVPPSLDVINDEAERPRFEGEVLGIFIGSLEGEIPEAVVTFDQLCNSKDSERVSEDDVGDLALKFSLPSPFELLPDSGDTGYYACGETPTVAKWAYAAPQPNGYPGELTIARSPLKYDVRDVSAERVEATEIGGLPAVLIKALSPNGVSSSAGFIFPGDSVTTFAYASGIPEDDLTEVAEIVAAAIREGG